MRKVLQNTMLMNDRYWYHVIGKHNFPSKIKEFSFLAFNTMKTQISFVKEWQIFLLQYTRKFDVTSAVATSLYDLLVATAKMGKFSHHKIWFPYLLKCFVPLRFAGVEKGGIIWSEYCFSLRHFATNIITRLNLFRSRNDLIE